MKYFLWTIRIIVAVLFIFSGFVKANDPLGLSYKMDEFFEVWGMHWLMPYSLAMSIAMIAFEIIAGVALLLGYAYRLFAYLLLALVVYTSSHIAEIVRAERRIVGGVACQPVPRIGKAVALGDALCGSG